MHVAALDGFQSLVEIRHKAFAENKAVWMNIVSFALLRISAVVKTPIGLHSAAIAAAAEVINTAAAVSDPDNGGKRYGFTVEHNADYAYCVNRGGVHFCHFRVLPHHKLHGNVSVNVKRIRYIIHGAVLAKKTDSLTAAARTAYLDYHAWLKVFKKLVNCLLLGDRIKPDVEILPVDFPDKRCRMLYAGKDNIHIVFVEEGSAVYAGFTAVNLNPKRIDKAGAPNILPCILNIA